MAGGVVLRRNSEKWRTSSKALGDWAPSVAAKIFNLKLGDIKVEDVLDRADKEWWY
jgi:hypothetical protein